MNKILFCFCCVLMLLLQQHHHCIFTFSALCQVQPLIARKFKSCEVLSRKQILSLDRKIRIKSPDHLFGLHFFDSVLYIIVFRASVLSFLIRVEEVPRKIIYYLLFCFSQILSCLPFPSFCKPRPCFFLCKNLLAILRNSRTSRISLFPARKNYFIMGTNLANQIMMSYV